MSKGYIRDRKMILTGAHKNQCGLGPWLPEQYYGRGSAKPPIEDTSLHDSQEPGTMLGRPRAQTRGACAMHPVAALRVLVKRSVAAWVRWCPEGRKVAEWSGLRAVPQDRQGRKATMGFSATMLVGS